MLKNCGLILEINGHIKCMKLLYITNIYLFQMFISCIFHWICWFLVSKCNIRFGLFSYSYEMLPLEEQLEIANQIGTTRSQILSNLGDLSLGTSFL